MKLKCLGSSSKGNCYILESDTEALVLEVGISLMEVKKALDFNISKVVGALISHEHQDHSKYIRDYLKAGIDVYSSDETQSALEIITGEYAKAMVPNKAYKIGGFTVQPFELIHDVPCLGFYIKHKDFGKLLFVTDSECVPQNFKNLGINHIMVEANYSKEILDQYYGSNREHVLTGHMEFQTTLNFLSTNDNPQLRNVVLIHLSDKNSDSAMFSQNTKETVNENCDVYIAKKGLVVDLNLMPLM